MHAGLSRQQTEEGFATVGVLLALEALPKSMDKPERPYLPEAEGALNAALDALLDRNIMKGHSAAFSPDGTWVVTASGDNTARLWDVMSTQALIDRARERVPRPELTQEEKERFFVLSE